MARASGFEIVDEKYIKKLKAKSENENTQNSTETQRTFSKSRRMKEMSKQI